MRFHARQHAAATLILVASFAGASACTADTGSGQSQLPDGVVMMRDRPADTVTLVPPKGWDCYNKKPQPAIVYKCVRRAETTGYVSSLYIEHYLSRFVLHSGSPFDGEEAFDVTSRFNIHYVVSEKDPIVTQLEKLPERTIDGAKAYGKTYIGTSTYKKEPTQYRKTRWMVGRSDGVWEISVYSAADSGTIPPELLQAVDTITWIPTPEPEPQSSGGTQE